MGERGIIIFFLISTFLNFLRSEKLLFSYVVMRHGARNVKYNIWNPENMSNNSYLTETGKAEAFAAGVNESKRSKDMDASSFYKKFKIYSSNIERNIETARHFVQGFFNSTDPSIDYSNIEIIPENENYLIRAYYNCLDFGYEIENQGNSSVYDQFDQETLEIRKEFAKVINWDNPPSILETFYITGNMKCYEADGRKVPEMSTELNYETSRIRDFYLFFALHGTKSQQVITSYYTLKQLKESIECVEKSNNFMGEKCFEVILHSSHDWNIISLLNIFNITDPLCFIRDNGQCGVNPPFASQLRIELIEVEGQNKIQIYYMDQKVPSAFGIQLPMNVEGFKKEIEEFLRLDFNFDCRGIDKGYTPYVPP